MKTGVPFHLAFGMPKEKADALVLTEVERMAMVIVMSELDGSKFNWGSMSFEDPR